MGAVTDRPTIEQIATEAMAYPDHVLEGCETGLALFSAAFLGRNDVVHLAIADLKVTCVDNNPTLLDEMRKVYPDDWEFVEADAYQFAETSKEKWDVVTVDPWTNQFQKVADNVALWCKLGRKVVVIGTGTHTVLTAPEPWALVQRVFRSDYAGGVYWDVLQ